MVENRPDTLRPAASARSLKRGDVPEATLARYLTDAAAGRTLGFYVDARATRPAFRDRGDRLLIDRHEPAAIRDMMAIAAHRGWQTVEVRGSQDFRREAWIAGRVAGLDVAGYRPTARELEQADRTRRRREERAVSSDPDRPTPKANASAPLSYAARAAIVEAVVRDRILDPDRGARLLDRARERLDALVAMRRPPSRNSDDREHRR